jgi:hypothetical protein
MDLQQTVRFVRFSGDVESQMPPGLERSMSPTVLAAGQVRAGA